jgi:hypothetical protein
MMAARRFARRDSFAASLILAFLILCPSCGKKRPEASPEPSMAESPSPEPQETLTSFASEGSFTEPDEGAVFSKALEGGQSCPPVRIRGNLACAIGDRIVILEKDGSSRSISLSAECREILCSFEAKGLAHLLVWLKDGSLASIEYEKLATNAELKADGGKGIYAVSGLKLIHASGKTIERLSLPDLLSEESAEATAEIKLIASNGLECLVFQESESLSRARFVDPADLSAAFDQDEDKAAAEERTDDRVVWIGSMKDGFIALMEDGRAAYLRKDEEIEFLSGSFNPNLDGSASAERCALFRENGQVCFASAGLDGKVRTEDAQITAELAMPLTGGWLWYSGGLLGYARTSGTSLWEIPTSLSPRFPPFLWEGRIVLCAYDGLYLFPGDADRALERSIRDVLLTPETEEAVLETLAAMRESDDSGSGGSRTEFDMEPFRPGLKKSFPKTWRLSIFEPEKSRSYRIRVEGAGEFYLAVFDAEGNKLVSNVGYGLEESIELSLTQGKKYAIAFAPRDKARDSEPAALSILAR